MATARALCDPRRTREVCRAGQQRFARRRDRSRRGHGHGQRRELKQGMHGQVSMAIALRWNGSSPRRHRRKRSSLRVGEPRKYCVAHDRWVKSRPADISGVPAVDGHPRPYCLTRCVIHRPPCGNRASREQAALRGRRKLARNQVRGCEGGMALVVSAVPTGPRHGPRLPRAHRSGG